MAHYEKLRVRELLSPNPTLANELVFSPLEDWNMTTSEFLYTLFTNEISLERSKIKRLDFVPFKKNNQI